ncbi:Uncharacterised protein [Staphylococcus gallinarum]|uniref:Uncharacterized protein n=1 Tax=Staphylococcus gallinarum TaxID=1293 RepID=A0A380FA24_STAGA|nr:Uncharacterised protein [Staphylococcus gallinarum]
MKNAQEAGGIYAFTTEQDAQKLFNNAYPKINSTWYYR